MLILTIPNMLKRNILWLIVTSIVILVVASILAWWHFLETRKQAELNANRPHFSSLQEGEEWCDGRKSATFACEQDSDCALIAGACEGWRAYNKDHEVDVRFCSTYWDGIYLCSEQSGWNPKPKAVCVENACRTQRK